MGSGIDHSAISDADASTGFYRSLGLVAATELLLAIDLVGRPEAVIEAVF